jgi:hypothetical protein
MKHRFRTLAWLLGLALLVALLATGGCRKLKTMSGIGETIETPEPGTPEATVQEVLKAGLERSEQTGWERYSTLLHSTQQSTQSLRSWRQFNYVSLRKKVGNYLKDPTKFSFVIMDEEEGEDGTVTLFLESKNSEMPTPCTVKKDTDGSWRITKCSL